jgi:hypothetical protein
MAFAYTVTDRGVMGNLKYQAGAFTNGTADSGGTINLSFNRVIGSPAITDADTAAAIQVDRTKRKKVVLVSTAGSDGQYTVWGK